MWSLACEVRAVAGKRPSGASEITAPLPAKQGEGLASVLYKGLGSKYFRFFWPRSNIPNSLSNCFLQNANSLFPHFTLEDVKPFLALRLCKNRQKAGDTVVQSMSSSLFLEQAQVDCEVPGQAQVKYTFPKQKFAPSRINLDQNYLVWGV